MGKQKIELDLANVKVVIIQCLHNFLGGDLQVAYGALLRLACKQKLPCQKALEFFLIDE